MIVLFGEPLTYTVGVFSLQPTARARLRSFDEMAALNLYTTGAIGRQGFSFWFDWSEPMPGEIRDAEATMRSIRNNAGGFDKISLTIVDCPGGDADQAISMYDLLTSQGVPVETRAIGMCASAATILFAAGSERISTNNCQFLIHEARYPWHDGGTAAALEKDAAELRRTNEKIAEIYASVSKKTKDEWLATMAEDRMTSAQIMQEFGLVSKIDQVVALNTAETSQMFNFQKMAQEKTGWFASLMGKLNSIEAETAPVEEAVVDVAAETAPADAASVENTDTAEIKESLAAIASVIGELKTAMTATAETAAKAMAEVTALKNAQKENNANRVANLANMSRQANPEQNQTVRNGEPRKLSLSDLTSTR